MEQLLKLVNVELTAKLAISALLASAVIATGASALATGIEAEDRTHLEHKLYLEENTNPDSEDDMSWEEYEASQQAKTARHANDVIAKAYGRKS
ncbi:hypothetical protein [Psychrobacter faecalis]|uniref:hypothetical protein n=1 Tax=Psychrobacter faecalis TaxID=180588 RepID=UPI0028A78581|nr:hypothetical protein [Psychrobacter faecalis]